MLNPFERIEAAGLLNNDESVESIEEASKEEIENEVNPEELEREAPVDSTGVSLEERHALTK
jgi:hypothetical protein